MLGSFPMNYSSRFFLWAPIILFVLLAAGISVHWYRTAKAYERQIVALKGQEAMPGVTLNWSSVSFAGFPFRVDANFQNFSAMGQGPHGPFSVSSERLSMHALTYGGDRKVFEAAGNQRLSWVDAAGRKRDFTFQPGQLRASAVRDDNGLLRFDVDIENLAAPGLSIGRAQFHMRRAEDGNAIEMVAQADQAKGDLGAFGKQVGSLRVFQTLVRARSYMLLLQGKTTASETHGAWHDEGGVANVTRTELNGKENAMTPEQAGAITTLLEALY
jgi:hypothetical protein